MSACDACLRRTELIAAVAPRLDIEWRRRSAPAGVLALPDDALLALDPTGCAARGYAAFAAAPARDRAKRAGLALVCRCDAAYPAGLHELADAPAVLHVAGRAEALAPAGAVAIVGARRGTPYGIEIARALGRSLAAAGVPIVSGMALGIDSAAHVGALDPPGAPAPVAVLAGGADVPYPASRRRLYERLVERGCVVSELPPGFSAFRWCFVARNRIIAALAALTVVVEAAERSGSLTTADFAAQVGRPVLAVPGPDHVAVLGRHERADRVRRRRRPRRARRARPAPRPRAVRRGARRRRPPSRSSRASGGCWTRSSAATAASPSSSRPTRAARRCCATSPTSSSAASCGGTSAGATSGRSATTGRDYPDAHAEPRPRRALDRRLRLRRRRRDPGGSEGVRALRRPRDDGDHRADRAEHRRGHRRAPGARRVHRRAGARGRGRHRRRRGEDRHARDGGDRRARSTPRSTCSHRAPPW